MLRKIEVVIPPFALDRVQEALLAVGADGLTVTEVKVLDAHARSACYRGAIFDVAFTARCKLETVVSDDRVARVVEALRANVDGPAELVLHSVEDAVRIRTGQPHATVRAA